MRFHKIANVNKALDFIASKGVKLVSIGAEGEGGGGPRWGVRGWEGLPEHRQDTSVHFRMQTSRAWQHSTWHPAGVVE